MDAVVLDLGQSDGGAVPRLRKRLAADIPATLAAKCVEGWPAGVDEELAKNRRNVLHRNGGTAQRVPA